MEIFHYVNTYINIYVLHSGLSFFWEKPISSRSVQETGRKFSRNLVFFGFYRRKLKETFSIILLTRPREISNIHILSTLKSLANKLLSYNFSSLYCYHYEISFNPLMLTAAKTA